MGRLGDIKMNRDLTSLLCRLSYLLFFFILKIWFIAVNGRGITDPYDFTVKLDALIPFNKYFIIPYVYWYIYLAIGLLILAVMDYKNYFRLLFAICLGEFISITIYVFMPSTTQRPTVAVTDVFTWAVNVLYKMDPHINCLPSIHILDTFLITLFLLLYSRKMSMRIFAWISAVSICISTLFIKQHVILDVAAALILGFIVYYIATCDKIFNNKRMKKLLHIVIPDHIRHNYGYYRNREAGDAGRQIRG
jgi:membrane-associated phospholipid phosphatase